MKKPLMILALSVLIPGCALTDKGENLGVRYFSPEVPRLDPSQRAPQKPATGEGIALRLGRVSASAHLRKYIVFRPTPVEISIHEDRWWAEAPEEYLRRALVEALFVDDGIEQSLSAAAPTLDVELLAFEEIIEAKNRKARVSIRFALHDEQKVFLAETVTVDRPLEESADMVKLTTEIAHALGTSTEDVAGRVAKKLASMPIEKSELEAADTPTAPEVKEAVKAIGSKQP